MTPQEIKSLRSRLGLTQEAFAKVMGVSRIATVSEWENGSRNPSGSAVKLMELLEKSVAETK